MSYQVLEKWVLEETETPDDDSRKEVQIVRDEDSGSIYVRAPYYGPSGKYGRDAPTYAVSEAVEQNLMEALEEAFPKARRLRKKKEIEKTLDETDLDLDELRKIAERAEEAGGIEELLADE